MTLVASSYYPTSAAVPLSPSADSKLPRRSWIVAKIPRRVLSVLAIKEMSTDMELAGASTVLWCVTGSYLSLVCPGSVVSKLVSFGFHVSYSLRPVVVGAMSKDSSAFLVENSFYNIRRLLTVPGAARLSSVPGLSFVFMTSINLGVSISAPLCAYFDMESYGVLSLTYRIVRLLRPAGIGHKVTYGTLSFDGGSFFRQSGV